MNWKELINEASITIALLATLAALVIVAIGSGIDAIGPTRLPELAGVLAGALAGTKIAK